MYDVSLTLTLYKVDIKGRQRQPRAVSHVSCRKGFFLHGLCRPLALVAVGYRQARTPATLRQISSSIAGCGWQTLGWDGNQLDFLCCSACLFCAGFGQAMSTSRQICFEGHPDSKLVEVSRMMYGEGDHRTCSGLIRVLGFDPWFWTGHRTM